jgi:hypothetical protein
MSKEADRSAQEYMAREDIEGHLDSREGFAANGEYSKGELEGMGSRELLDGYTE